MKPLKSLIVLLVSYFVSQSQVLATPELAYPIATVLRIDSSGKPIRILNKIPNTDTIINLGERLWLRCTAAYPVQWVYHGQGAPTLSTTTSTEEVSNLFKAELKIESTMEKHTGKYVCRSTERQELRTYYYMYVPGPQLFIAAKGKEILFSEGNSTVTIPCTVSQKDAHVTLQKSLEDILQAPIKTGYTFDPRVGFRLKISDLEDPIGIYVCSATYGNIFRLIEYTVMSMDSINRNNLKSCTPNPCGRNARCRIFGSIVTCSCIETFRGDPYHLCEKPCLQNSDCPVHLFCNSTMKTCEDPCSVYSCDYSVSECKVTSHSPGCVQSSSVRQEPCGKKPACPSGTRCKVTNGQHKCVCGKGFLGNIPEMGCYAGCQNALDCSSSKSCEYPTCVDPCLKFNPCGVNANCVVQRHNRICECKEGYTGQPYQICHKMKMPVTTISTRNITSESVSLGVSENPCGPCGPRSACNLINGKMNCSCKSGYKGQPPNCRPSCATNETCSLTLACINGRCIDPCGQNRVCGQHAECTVQTHQPICTCYTDFEGNAYEECKSKTRTTATSSPPSISPRCFANVCTRKRPLIIVDNARKLLETGRKLLFQSS